MFILLHLTGQTKKQSKLSNLVENYINSIGIKKKATFAALNVFTTE